MGFLYCKSCSLVSVPINFSPRTDNENVCLYGLACLCVSFDLLQMRKKKNLLY